MSTPNASPISSPRSSIVTRISGIILCLSGLILTTQAAPLDEAATRELLGKIAAIRQAHPSIQANFREEKSGGILARPAISSGKIWYSTPDKFRRETVGAGKESLIVSNGELLWMYYPAFKEAERYDLKKQKFLNQGIAAFTTGLGFADVERDFKIAADQEASGYTITLVPKRSAVSRMISQLVVHFGKMLELESVESITPRGEKTVNQLTNLRTETPPAATFDFTPPADVNVTTPLGK